ncbi:LSM domain-containing protein [Elsinoe ampelina]|uniref:LSM domain-containing protein n=1 Tax=Elsinoe ampelina TaxID=302913 RepID=A0A6A6GDM2_9PEZI|nr:LSM domain-containing protein [Elsinoe ampelina]
MSNGDATAFLTSLLNKSLRIHVTDGRMFVGQMKCTDQERNIILACTHEYRRPSKRAIEQAAQNPSADGKVRLDMVKRFVGLVVVPGQYITKIELD